MQAVVETPDFLSDAKAAGLSEAERRAVVDLVSREPKLGEIIQGAGGARKLRFAGRGKGKSGSLLLAVFGKGETVNLTKAERNELRKELAGLAVDYRKGRGRRAAPRERGLP